MSNLSKVSKEIPNTKSNFQIDVEGEVTKNRFIGDFVCKIPRKKEQCSIDKHRALLNGPQPEQLSPETLRFHHMIAYLRFTLDERDCPKWWKESDLGYELYDENVVRSIYDHVMGFEVEWLKAVWGVEAVEKLQGKKDSNGESSENKEA